MNQEFLYIILIIALGYFLKRLNILQEKDGETISKIIFKITLPSLVLVTFDSVKIEITLMLLPIFVILYSILISIFGLILFRNEERELKGSFLILSSGFNVGLFAFPLVYIIWGTNGITYFSMFDVGTSVITFGMAYILGSYFSKDGLTLRPLEIVKRLSKSIPLMTYLIASLLNFCQIKLPGFIIEVASTVSQANVPLSLLLLGIYLQFKFDKKLIKPVLKFLSFRYSFALLFGLLLFWLLPYEAMFRYTILIGFLLPAAAAAVPFAVEFKYSSESVRLMATITNITMIISMVILYAFARIIS